MGDGRAFDKGVLLIRDGLIEAVGTDLAVPPDAEVVKGDGLIVYPGFIDGWTSKGLKLPDWKPDQDAPPNRNAEASPAMRHANRKGVRPELRAVDHLDLPDGTLDPLRKAGFTTALIAPSGGMINGVAALVNLSGQPKRESVVRPAVAVGMGFGAPGGGYPGSLMGVFAHLRQTLLDAGQFRAAQAGYKGEGRRPPADDVLAALLPVLDGTVPLLFEAEGRNEIARSSRLTEEFGLRPVLVGGTEAWKEAPDLARRKASVLVGLNFGAEPRRPPTSADPPQKVQPDEGKETPAKTETGDHPKADGPDRKPDVKLKEDAGKAAEPKTKEDAGKAAEPKPEDDQDLPEPVMRDRHRKWVEKVANAKRLHEAGVRFAFSTRGVKDAAEFWKNLRRAIKEGLPKEAALRALTVTPAAIFGVERQMGTAEAGKVANLVVMSGDFADEKSKARYVFIDGKRFDLDPDATEKARKPVG